jgi:hypothetical protein
VDDSYVDRLFGKYVNGPEHEAVVGLARQILDEHGLQDWSFEFDSAKARAGQCRFGDKVISVSRLIVGMPEVEDTIRHEVAHALAGPREHHGRAWRAACARVGARPERIFDGEVANGYRWHGVCDGCGGTVIRRHLLRGSAASPLEHVSTGRVAVAGYASPGLVCGTVRWKEVHDVGQKSSPDQA